MGPGFRKFFTFETAAQSETFAYFANAEYEINEQWRVSGGLRYTEDEKILDASIFEFILNVVGVPLGLRGSGEKLDAHTWDKPIGHISVEYSPATMHSSTDASPPAIAPARSTRSPKSLCCG